jgi:hypothetical protein
MFWIGLCNEKPWQIVCEPYREHEDEGGDGAIEKEVQLVQLV